jgi:hypothetical protein
MLVRDKHSSLLDLFVSYKENKVLLIWSFMPYSQNFIFIVTYEFAQLTSVTLWKAGSASQGQKHSSLLDLFVSLKKCC